MKSFILIFQRILTFGMRGLIRGYQLFLSPLLYLFFPGWGCRFIPTCSEYARECILLFGPWKGIGLTLKRIGKCHPFHPGGIDLPKGINEDLRT